MRALIPPDSRGCVFFAEKNKKHSFFFGILWYSILIAVAKQESVMQNKSVFSLSLEAGAVLK